MNRLTLSIIRWITGWIILGEGIAMVLSLGFYRPVWSIMFALWHIGVEKNERQDQNAD